MDDHAGALLLNALGDSCGSSDRGMCAMVVFGSEQWSMGETKKAEVCVIRSGSGETRAQSSVLAGRGLPVGGEAPESAELERLPDDRAVERG